MSKELPLSKLREWNQTGRLDRPEIDNTFLGRATHIEFNDVVYQVARDRLTIHLVDDHLLQKKNIYQDLD